MKNNYTKCPFTISDRNQDREFRCPKYSYHSDKKKTGGLIIEFCLLEENVKEYNELGARIISCKGCEFKNNGFKEVSNDDMVKEVYDTKLSNNKRSNGSALYLLRHMG
jgi:hypothetical protein